MYPVFCPVYLELFLWRYNVVYPWGLRSSIDSVPGPARLMLNTWELGHSGKHPKELWYTAAMGLYRPLVRLCDPILSGAGPFSWRLRDREGNAGGSSSWGACLRPQIIQ